jgi:hypothetical protein
MPIIVDSDGLRGDVVDAIARLERLATDLDASGAASGPPPPTEPRSATPCGSGLLGPQPKVVSPAVV